MNDKIFNKIKKASKKHIEAELACDSVAIEAQKHIDWNKDVGCCYVPGDGVCIEIEAHLCPATRFFELMEFIGNDMIDQKTYLSNCI